MEIDAIFEQLRETANGRAGLVRVGRHCDVEFLIEVGNHALLLAAPSSR